MNSRRAWIPAVLCLGAVFAAPSFAQSRSEEARKKPIAETEGDEHKD